MVTVTGMVTVYASAQPATDAVRATVAASTSGWNTNLPSLHNCDVFATMTKLLELRCVI